MKPPRFDYERPTTVGEVLDLLAAHDDDASLLAGGQSLLPLLNMRFARPEVVIDLERVDGLDTIEVTPQAVVVGAGVRLARLERDPEVAAALPVLPRAVSFVAHPQIRNRTTIGGSLCHADPAAELPCVAIATGARLHLRSKLGDRTVDAADFFESVFMTSKRSDELLVAVEFPRTAGLTYRYDEIARRHGDFPFVGLCLGLAAQDGVVTAVRAAAAGVADKPLRLEGLERAFVGRSIAEATEPAAQAASAEAAPTNDQHGSAEFRRGLLRGLVRRLAGEFTEAMA
ncbi:FAD binding domain-containing protein [Rhodococcus qingshengii]|jgi:carbon-monoxide dehydrogenase medium subunit|nr:FAD binding domain-containing protein [Rhodococcus qingshengii]